MKKEELAKKMELSYLKIMGDHEILSGKFWEDMAIICLRALDNDGGASNAPKTK